MLINYRQAIEGAQAVENNANPFLNLLLVQMLQVRSIV